MLMIMLRSPVMTAYVVVVWLKLAVMPIDAYMPLIHPALVWNSSVDCLVMTLHLEMMDSMLTMMMMCLLLLLLMVQHMANVSEARY